LLTVTLNGPLVVLTTWFPKAAGLGDMLRTGAVPVPVSDTLPNAVP